MAWERPYMVAAYMEPKGSICMSGGVRVIFILWFIFICCKEFNLAQRGLEKVLPNKSSFVYLEASGHKTSLTMWLRVGALGHIVLAQPPVELETKVSHVDSQSVSVTNFPVNLKVFQMKTKHKNQNPLESAPAKAERKAWCRILGEGFLRNKASNYTLKFHLTSRIWLNCTHWQSISQAAPDSKTQPCKC